MSSFSRCIYFFQNGFYNDALSEFKIILAADPISLYGLLGTALIHYIKEQYKESLSVYHSLIKLRLWQDRYHAESFEDPLSHDSKEALINFDVTVRLGIGMCQYNLGREQAANLAFVRALELSSTFTPAYLASATLKINQAISKNKVDEKTRLLDEAFTSLVEIYQNDPKNPVVCLLLCDHFFKMAEYAKAEKLAHRAIENTNHKLITARAQFIIAQYHHIEGRLDESVNFYKASLVSDPLFQSPKFGLAQVQMAQGNFNSAFKHLTSFIHSVPDEPEANLLLSVCTVGLLWSSQTSPAKIQDYSKRAYEHSLRAIKHTKFAKKIPAWIQYATCLEGFQNVSKIRHVYYYIIQLHKEEKIKVPAFIWNNLGTFEHFKGNPVHSLFCYIQALSALDSTLSSRSVDDDNSFSKDVLGDFLNFADFKKIGTSLAELSDMDALINADLPNVLTIDSPYPKSNSITKTIITKILKVHFSHFSLPIMFNISHLFINSNLITIGNTLLSALETKFRTFADIHMLRGQVSLSTPNPMLSNTEDPLFPDIKRALFHFTQAGIIEPLRQDIWCLQGIVHQKALDFSSAEKNFMVLESRPNPLSYALLALGNLSLETYLEHPEKRLQYAIPRFRKVLNRDPFNSFAANGLACALAYRGFLNEAYDIFSQIYGSLSDIDSESVQGQQTNSVLFNRANVALSMGDPGSAIGDYLDWLKRFPKSGLIPLNTKLDRLGVLMCLSRAYYATNDWKSCMEQLSIGLELITSLLEQTLAALVDASKYDTSLPDYDPNFGRVLEKLLVKLSKFHQSFTYNIAIVPVKWIGRIFFVPEATQPGFEKEPNSPEILATVIEYLKKSESIFDDFLSRPLFAKHRMEQLNITIDSHRLKQLGTKVYIPNRLSTLRKLCIQGRKKAERVVTYKKTANK